jgi:predicted nucleotidyltransferase
MGSAHEIVAASAAATARARLLIAAGRGEAMDGSSDQLGALVDVAKALADAGIAYAVIGGIAVDIHAQVPRATQDVDVAVTSTIPRDSVIATLGAAGFAHHGTYEHSVNFRHSSGEPVQIAMDPTFDEVIEGAETYEVGGSAVRVVRKDDLIAMKERSASDPARRPSKALQDRTDVALLRGDVPDPDEGW